MLVVVATGVLLASCAIAPQPSGKSRSKEYFAESEYGVKASPRIVATGQEIPKGGGRYQVGKPYTVRGKVYRPQEDPNYSAVGMASWYGSAFHGRKTANGEIYDKGELTAAHPTLPLPSYVRVTNLNNDRSVVLRVNDRGPFARGRIIDVSATAAEMLDFRHAGTAKVKVEYVGKAQMDGLDRPMLLASYRGPNDFGSSTLFASTLTPTSKRNIHLASLNPRDRRNPQQSVESVGAQQPVAPDIVAPAFLPNTITNGDQLGPLILRAGFSTSYAPTQTFSRAHSAIESLSSRD